MNVRRSSYIVAALDDTAHLDIAQLLRGEIAVATKPACIVASLASAGRRYEIPLGELDALRCLPKHWVTVSEAQSRTGFSLSEIETFAFRGLIISDAKDAVLSEIRQREEWLSDSAWGTEAAWLHYASVRSFSGEATAQKETSPLVNNPDALASFVARNGPPPPESYSRSDEYVPLAAKDTFSPLEILLQRRQTVRAFDRSRPMSGESLGSLLRSVWGCHGITALGSGLNLLARTSPSGGSLHPIEAYVLTNHVDSLAPGVYHYSGTAHGLALMRELTQPEVRRQSEICCAGQSYAAEAHAVIIMTARFDREFWKYRGSARAYSVVMMDAGHLSQTFYLLATELGLGSFFTAAIDFEAISSLLQLEEPREAAVAVIGCGVTDSQSAVASLAREPTRHGEPG